MRRPRRSDPAGVFLSRKMSTEIFVDVTVRENTCAIQGMCPKLSKMFLEIFDILIP